MMNKIIKNKRAIAVVLAIGAWSSYIVADSKITDGPANLGSTTATRTPDGVLEVVGGSTTKPSLVVRGADCTSDSGTVSTCTPSLILTRGGNLGIGTISPQGALDVTSTTGGLIPPRMTTLQRNALSSPAKGAIIFNTDNNTLEINSGPPASPSWVGASNVVGDIKTGIQTTDHNGWIKLDGRLKSTLSPTQIANATALGIGTNLPDATNAFLTQNGAALGTVSGSNSKIIAQNQLPNVSVKVMHASVQTGIGGGNELYSDPNKTATVAGTNVAADYHYSMGRTTSIANAGNSSSINGGVTQQTFDVTPLSLSVNTFIYLGN